MISLYSFCSLEQWKNILSYSVAIASVWCALRAWWRTQGTLTIHRSKTFTLLFVRDLCHLVWIWIVWLIVQWQDDVLSQGSLCSGIALALLLIYARFIEPSRLIVRTHRLTLNTQKPMSHPITIVLLADLHIGLYSGHPKQLQRIVERVIDLQPDLVLVAGDWTYEPRLDQLAHLDVFQQIQCPIYAVNGNHDEQVPGPPLQAQLAYHLQRSEIDDIENCIIEYDDFRLVGVGDLWAGKAQFDVITDLPQDKPLLILAHNPDTIDLVPDLPNRPLMLSGHTHGGQVFIPVLTDFVLKQHSVHGHRYGLYHHAQGDVLVSAGTGLVGAPFRLGVPPVIDVINLS